MHLGAERLFLQYMLAIPIFGCYIPAYSFWHFDDFSWGNTRQVTEEGGKMKEVAVAEEPVGTCYDTLV